MFIYIKQFFGYSFGPHRVQVEINDSTCVEQLIGLIIEKIPQLKSIIQNNPAVVNLYALPYNRLSESGRLCVDYGICAESNVYLAPQMGNVIIQSIADYKQILDNQ